MAKEAGIIIGELFVMRLRRDNQGGGLPTLTDCGMTARVFSVETGRLFVDELAKLGDGASYSLLQVVHVGKGKEEGK